MRTPLSRAIVATTAVLVQASFVPAAFADAPVAAAAPAPSGAARIDAAETPVALRAARLYVSPDAPPVDDAVVLLRGGAIVAAGRQADVAVPANAREMPQCRGAAVVAGFQNSHVHFIGPAWDGAATREPAVLRAALTDTYTRWGFTTVVDLASNRDDTLALRRRIQGGEIPGPRILTASWPLFPEHGLPIYIHDLPPALLARMPQPASPAEAARQVRENLDAGADATKLFIVTPQGHGQVKTLRPDIARAAVDESHRRGAPVFVHPTNFAGAMEAIDAGADVLAHDVFDDGSPWPDALLRRAIDGHVAMVPTLKLMPYELAKEQVPESAAAPLMAGILAHVHRFDAAGGTLMFGTDVGYMSDVDPTDEYRLLARAGLSPMRILAMLTTTPAAFWKESTRRGRVAAGQDADLVVLDADPAADAARFAQVRCTFRAGQALYVAPAAPVAAPEAKR
jgi:imidazolonepropionase-like amidohydrolase